MVGRVREVGDERTVLVSVIDARGPPADARRSSSTRRRSSRRTGSARSRSATRATRTRWTASRARRSTTSRPSRPRACSAATRTGAARSGCRSTTWRSASSSIYQRFFGDDFKLEYPTGSGEEHTFGEIAQDLADRIVAIWLPGRRRPPPGLRRHREAPDGSGLEGQPDLQRVLPRRQRRRPRCDAPDRLDGARRRPDPRPARVRSARARCGLSRRSPVRDPVHDPDGDHGVRPAEQDVEDVVLGGVDERERHRQRIRGQ